MTHVGKNIKRIRTARNMTISDVANEHVSRGMISMIENGKTQPSIERLQHIARKLGVNVSELVEEIPREELQRVMKKVLELWGQGGWKQAAEAEQLMRPILEKNITGYEAARMHEIYARILYYLYLFAIDLYKEIDNNDWNAFIDKAMERYRALQMEWRVVRCYMFLAEIEFDRAEYHSTIDLFDKGMKELNVMDSIETKSMYIQLLSAKAFTFEALGQHEQAHGMVDQAIDFARTHMVLDNYYQLLNMKVWLHYDRMEMEKARQYAEESYLFAKLLKEETLLFEYRLTQVSREEFFEKNYEKALRDAEELIQDIEASGKYPKDYKGEFIVLANNMLARALTRVGRYEEALSLFKRNPIRLPERVRLSPLDTALRVLSASYEALCRYHLNDSAQAEKLARLTVDRLHAMPHTSLYHFAREVLEEVTSK